MALTVLGRPPGLTQIPLSEAESEMLGVSISSPNSPATERPYSPQDRFSAQPSWVLSMSSLLLPHTSITLFTSVFLSSLIMFCPSFIVHVCTFPSLTCVLRMGSSPPSSFQSFSLYSQDENNSACHQKVDYSVKMLSREQQDLQVSNGHCYWPLYFV